MQKRQPNFENLLKILRREKPDRPTLFEFFLNEDLYEMLADEKVKNSSDELRIFRVIITAFKNAGYDYATIPTWHTQTLWFHKNEVEQKSSKSLNEGFVITDEQSFEEYDWPDPEIGNYEIYGRLAKELPEGMKLIASTPGGILENAIELVGYENLCMISLENEELTTQIFDAVGSRLLRYYEIISPFPAIGAVICNDDWGFKTQTMFSPEMLRKYVFHWNKKFVEVIHDANKPANIHSCGNRSEIMNDIIRVMMFDGLHSFEDIILTVEDAWKNYHTQIAILGGIDMDFLCNSTPEAITERARMLLTLTSEEGGYALGSGNSIPKYVPYENFNAMIMAALEF
jgi:uroporphyrinogen decarboxylase